ncbi:hypothetical protein [Aliikangiella coralliicola]|uniref:Uncharacterized protein n=1 Tax=Aliikangiella coralliicola TaxID=2592383 RepID=A0A545U042_9GAMM|nr:hypothetical protein [Aliikangiella coralliicola]TQV82834.1 hypothetical protein FLL46_23995 [Aliikangiella coralliicola]
MKGFIKLHRKIIDWEWYGDINTFAVFLHLLLKANHRPKNWRGKVIERGQLVTGRKILSSELRLSEQQIRTCLKRLQSTNEITIKSTSQYSIVTLVNYSLHQDSEEQSTNDSTKQSTAEITNEQPTENGTFEKIVKNSTNESTNNQPAESVDTKGVGRNSNQQLTDDLTNKQPTTNQQLTTNKKLKNEKNVKKDLKDINTLKSLPPEKLLSEKELVFFKPDCVDLGIWKEFISLRKRKKAEKTVRATRSLIKNLDECVQNGVSRTDMILMCLDKGWKGVNYQWYLNLNSNNRGAANGIDDSNIDW